MAFCWSLSDLKYPQVFRTLLSIQANLSNSVVWVVSTRPPLSSSPSPLIKPLWTIRSAPIIIGIIIILMFHYILALWQGPIHVSLFVSFAFYFVVHRHDKVYYSASYLLLLITIRSGTLAGIRWSFCISKCQRILWVSSSTKDSGLCLYHLVVLSNFNFLHYSQWITFPTQSSLVSFSFSASLLHSLIIGLIVSSLSPHNLHLLFCYVLVFHFNIIGPYVVVLCYYYYYYYYYYL